VNFVDVFLVLLCSLFLFVCLLFVCIAGRVPGWCCGSFDLVVYVASMGRWDGEVDLCDGRPSLQLVTLAGYCVHSTVVPAIVPKIYFAPSEEIHGKELLVCNGGGCYGKRRKRGR
jgi:hypothetical protein